jgi:CRP-like cAMP-binding protein
VSTKVYDPFIDYFTGLGPGSMLGDVEVAEGLTHFLATATTTRRSVLLEVPRSFFETLLELNEDKTSAFLHLVNSRRDVEAKAALDSLVRSGAAKKGGAAPPAHARICEDFEAALERRVANALEASWARSPAETTAAVQDALARRPARRDSGASRVGVVKGLERAAKTVRAPAIEVNDEGYRDALAVTMSALRTDSIRDARRTAPRRRRGAAPTTPADLIGKPSIVDTPDVHAAHRALTELSAITDRQRRALPSDTLLRMTREILTPDMNALMKSKRRRRPGDFT